jgi:hypothetical protein
MCWSLFMAGSGDCEGSCTFLNREPKGNSSGLLVSLSYLTCGSVLALSNMWTRFVQHLLAAEPQWGLACRQAREPREKNRVSIVIDSLDFTR